MIILPFLLNLLFTRLYNEVYALEMCGRFTYQYVAAHDNLNISDALEAKETPTRAECFSDCFHHRYCNRLLYNELTNECQLHSSEGFSIFSPTAPGFKYYAGDCMIWKRSTLPGCPSLKANFPESLNPTGQCYNGENWVDFVCKKNEWYNSYAEMFLLPAPITPGFVADITGTWDSSSNLLCTLRQHDGVAETILLKIENGATCYIGQHSSGQWSSIVYIDPIPLSDGVPFTITATFNSTHYQISLDGTPVATDVLWNQISEANYVYMNNWGSIDHVLYTYP